MFKKEILSFNGKDYIVTLTRKAMLEIEDRQRLAAKKTAEDETAIEILSQLSDLENMDAELEKINEMKEGKVKDKKLIEYNKKYLPLTLKMSSSSMFDESIDPFEVVYILIKNYPKNDPLSKEEYENGLFELEEKMGLVELEIKFKEMYDKVFSEIGLVKQALQDHQKKQNQEKLPS